MSNKKLFELNIFLFRKNGTKNFHSKYPLGDIEYSAQFIRHKSTHTTTTLSDLNFLTKLNWSCRQNRSELFPLKQSLILVFWGKNELEKTFKSSRTWIKKKGRTKCCFGLGNFVVEKYWHAINTRVETSTQVVVVRGECTIGPAKRGVDTVEQDSSGVILHKLSQTSNRVGEKEERASAV